MTGKKALQQMSAEDIILAVEEKYSQVAKTPGQKFNFPVGRKFAESVGYSKELLDRLPATMSESFSGAGNPHPYVRVFEGASLLDLGCGAGLDLLLYAGQVGPGGKLYGVDISQDMLDKAKLNLAGQGVKDFELFRSPADNIPLDDNMIDAVTSNGIYNLVPDKEAVFREVCRILKPGGQTTFAEIVLKEVLPGEIRKNIEDWFRCIGGALPEDEFLALMKKAGFIEVQVISKARNARCGHQLAVCANIRAYKPYIKSKQ
jgi:arsenite methyltransferase